jgi:hypothetical protein
MKNLILLFTVLTFIGCSKDENSHKKSDESQDKIVEDHYDPYATPKSPSYAKIYPVVRAEHASEGIQANSVHEINATTEELSSVEADGWKLTFSDEFDDANTAIAKGADPKCFSMPPGCMLNWWHREECPEFSAQLSNLNKCVWDAYNYYNYMDFDLPEKEGVNAFHPSQVEVRDGKLVLSAKKSFYPQIDCKRPFFDPRINHENYTTQCPIISGAVESKIAKTWDGKYIKGFTQAFGRWEVRAKLSHGPGSWPALWMLSQDLIEVEGKKCGWPFSGEIDLMESWTDKPEQVQAGMYSGDCVTENRFSKGFDFQAKEKYYPGKTKQQLKDTFWTEFHTYTVEWDSHKLRFLVDNIYLGQFTHGDRIRRHKWPYDFMPANVPQTPFYWILNNTIYKPQDPLLDPTKVPFPTQRLEIDYVKVYRKCTSSDNDCVKFDYQNLGSLCPGFRDYLGDYKGLALCKMWPHFSISKAKCLNRGGEVFGSYCAEKEGKYWKAREIKRECPWPRKYLGEYNGKIVCKAWPHFKIKESKCDGSKWENYCIWNQGENYRARQLR